MKAKVFLALFYSEFLRYAANNDLHAGKNRVQTKQKQAEKEQSRPKRTKRNLSQSSWIRDENEFHSFKTKVCDWGLSGVGNVANDGENNKRSCN